MQKIRIFVVEINFDVHFGSMNYIFSVLGIYAQYIKTLFWL